MSWLHKFKKWFSDKNKILFGGLGNKLFKFFNSKDFSEDQLEELEDILIQADAGANMALQIRQIFQKAKHLNTEESSAALKKQVLDFLLAKTSKLEASISFAEGLNIFICSGVNGAGKTTTIKKLCKLWEDHKILVACCDTFRAAAYEQLQVAISTTKAEYMHLEGKNTPDSVAYVAIKKAQQEKHRILLLDTSGRLQNKVNLMEEFTKFTKVYSKIDPALKPRTLLVLDGTSGQNLIDQIETFGTATQLDGLILTKFDGLVKGGIILQIADKFDVPIYFIGTGEGEGDLSVFNASEFCTRLLADEA